jgi:hypothetical protein
MADSEAQINGWNSLRSDFGSKAPAAGKQRTRRLPAQETRKSSSTAEVGQTLVLEVAGEHCDSFPEAAMPQEKLTYPLKTLDIRHLTTIQAWINFVAG